MAYWRVLVGLSVTEPAIDHSYHCEIDSETEMDLASSLYTEYINRDVAMYTECRKLIRPTRSSQIPVQGCNGAREDSETSHGRFWAAGVERTWHI